MLKLLYSISIHVHVCSYVRLLFPHQIRHLNDIFSENVLNMYIIEATIRRQPQVVNEIMSGAVIGI